MGPRSLIGWDAAILAVVIVGAVWPPAYLRRSCERRGPKWALGEMIVALILPVFSAYLAFRLPNDPHLTAAKWVLLGQGLFVWAGIEIMGVAKYRVARRHAELR